MGSGSACIGWLEERALQFPASQLDGEEDPLATVRLMVPSSRRNEEAQSIYLAKRGV